MCLQGLLFMWSFKLRLAGLVLVLLQCGIRPHVQVRPHSRPNHVRPASVFGNAFSPICILANHHQGLLLPSGPLVHHVPQSTVMHSSAITVLQSLHCHVHGIRQFKVKDVTYSNQYDTATCVAATAYPASPNLVHQHFVLASCHLASSLHCCFCLMLQLNCSLNVTAELQQTHRVRNSIPPTEHTSNRPTERLHCP